MKVFKLYFLRSDTPFIAGYQSKQRYHTCWGKYAKKVNNHNVYKIKLFGIITIYKLKRGIM